jgi:hypothetical protein
VTNRNSQDVCVQVGALTEGEPDDTCAANTFGQSCLATWGSEGHYGVCAAAPLAQDQGHTVACAPCPKCPGDNEVCGVSTEQNAVSSYNTVTCCTTGVDPDSCCNTEEIETDTDCDQEGGGGGGP